MDSSSGEEVKVHGKGMQKALRCRELLGHEDHPELLLKEEEPIFTTLDNPLPVYYAVPDRQASRWADAAAQPWSAFPNGRRLSK